MSKFAATVIIPTFNHGETLHWALKSALAQTVREIQVIVVGDGAGDGPRAIIDGLSDERIHYVSFPKGERHGEAWRHEVICRGTAPLICYLSDDDLWFDDHIAQMLATVGPEGYFAHTMAAIIPHPGGQLPEPLVCDLTRAAHRRVILEVQNLIPLSTAGHGIDIYLRSGGWKPAPLSEFSDLHMWRRIIRAELKRVGDRKPAGLRSLLIPTTLHFPSPTRNSLTIQKRCAELEVWFDKLSTQRFPERIRCDVLEKVAKDYARTLYR